MKKTRLQKKAWQKLAERLDSELPVASENKGVSQVTFLLALLLLLGAASWYTAKLYKANTTLKQSLSSLQQSMEEESKRWKNENQALLAEVNSYKSKIDALQSPRGIAQQSSGLSTERVEYRTKVITLPNLSASIPQYFQATAFHDLWSDYIMYNEQNNLPSIQGVDYALRLEPLKIKEKAISETKETNTEELTSSTKPLLPTVSKVFNPKIYAVAGFTATTDNWDRGAVLEVGVNLFSESRWTALIDAGILNQRTSIINQTVAAKAGFEAGLDIPSIASEVEDESSTFTNYTFASAAVGAGYKLTPKLQLFSKLKASYIFDRLNFSRAELEQNNGRVLRVEESLGTLVNDNQVNRWGFSGVIGADYALNDKVGIQISYNKYLTPLVSQLPLGESTADNHLRDFTKIGVSYNF